MAEKKAKAKPKKKASKPKKEAKSVGRPISLEDPEIKAKFLTAMSFNMSIEACSAYAGIAKQTYYNYIEKNPGFLDEIEQKRHIPYHKAVKAIIDNFEDDPHLALKYLERKYKDEFAPRRELTGAEGKDLFKKMSDEDLEKFISE